MECVLPLLAATVLTLGGCGPAPGGAGAGAAADPSATTVPPDTLRGTLLIVGSEPATSAALRLADGGGVQLLGEEGVLRQLSGLEVMVEGSAVPPRGFRVAAATVRAHAGIAAVDGILTRDGEGWALRTREGERVPIARLPQALNGREGARVWLAGPLDRAPDAFGIVE